MLYIVSLYVVSRIEMHIKLLLLFLITSLISGCQSSGDLAVVSSIKPSIPVEGTLDEAVTFCPEGNANFKVGVATSNNVKACRGEPAYEDYNSNGQYVYLYKLSNKLVLTYLFSKDSKLIKVKGFRKKGSS